MNDTFRVVRTILRGLLYDSEVLKAIEPAWAEPGLFESPGANYVASAAIAHYRDYQFPLENGDEWLDQLADDKRVPEADLEDAERLWSRACKAQERKTASVLTHAERYFSQVRLQRLAEQIENLADRGDYGKADEVLTRYKPMKLKANGALQWADEDDMVAISYLWKPFLARGYITLLEGDSGTGKTTVMCDLIARLTSGWEMPPKDPEGERKPRKVLYLTTEDGWRDLTLPRLKAAGAEFEHVACWPYGEAKPRFPRDLYLLEQRIVENNIKMVVFDPLISFMEDQWSDANSAAHVRRLMDPLNDLAERLNIAFLGVRHFTKSKNAQAIHQGSGSGAWTQACRFQCCTLRHPKNPEEYVLVPSKANTTDKMWEHTHKFVIASAHVTMPGGKVTSYGRVVWKRLATAEKGRTADEWLAGKEVKVDTKIRPPKNRPGRTAI